jgi:two-component system sensor histidine kinase KdpD
VVLVASGVIALGVLIPRIDPGPAAPLRHLHALPVLAAAVGLGTVGGTLAAVATVLLRAPYLFAGLEAHGLTPAAVEDLVSDLTLLAAGLLGGALSSAARRHRVRSERLQAIQRALAEVTDLPSALERVRSLLGRGSGADRVAVAVREGTGWVVVGATGVARGSLAARVAAQGTPAFVRDVAGRGRPRRTLVVPLRARGEVLGVLALERAGEIGIGEREAWARLGGYLGLALENARLAARQRRFTAELAEKVEAATRHLAAMDRAKSAFVAVASHELRTPLTALLGFSELLAARRFAPDEVQRLAHVLRVETERLARIVEDLLDVTRLEQGLAAQVVPRALEVAPALEAAVAVFQRADTGPRILVVCGEPLPRAWADPDALDRVVKNLVSNALKYAPADTPVTVSARAAAGRVEITVADEGPGIPPEAQPHVFEPFYRAPPAASRARGSGLGLAVVKALVEAQGGTVRLESAPGRGTRVICSFREAPAVTAPFLDTLRREG